MALECGLSWISSNCWASSLKRLLCCASNIGPPWISTSSCIRLKIKIIFLSKSSNPPQMSIRLHMASKMAWYSETCKRITSRPFLSLLNRRNDRKCARYPVLYCNECIYTGEYPHHHCLFLHLGLLQPYSRPRPESGWIKQACELHRRQQNSLFQSSPLSHVSKKVIMKISSSLFDKQKEKTNFRGYFWTHGDLCHWYCSFLQSFSRDIQPLEARWWLRRWCLLFYLRSDLLLLPLVWWHCLLLLRRLKTS